MKTPITDAAMIRVLDAEATRMAGSQIEAVHKLYVPPLVARRLETDRAALMEALEGLVKANEEWNAAVAKIVTTPPNWSDSYLSASRAALTAARANFPQP